MTTDEQTSGRGRRSKVARLIDEYDLEGLGEEMAQRWTADDDRCCLRDLADQFNQAVLEAALVDECGQLLDGEIENIYRLLTNEDVEVEISGVESQLDKESDLESRQEKIGQEIEELRTKIERIET